MLLQTIKKSLPFSFQKKIADTFSHFSMHVEIKNNNTGKIEVKKLAESFTANYLKILYAQMGQSFSQSSITDYNTNNKLILTDGTVKATNPINVYGFSVSAGVGDISSGIVLSTTNTLPLNPLSQIDTTNIITNGTGVDQLLYGANEGVPLSINGSQTQIGLFRVFTNQSLLPIIVNRFYLKAYISGVGYYYFFVESIPNLTFDVGASKTISVYFTTTT